MNKEESLPNGEGFFLIICRLYYTMMIGGDDVDGIEIFKRWIDESIRIVAFTGAGVSTESGIKDFRSADGLYNEKWRPNCDNTTEFVS